MKSFITWRKRHFLLCDTMVVTLLFAVSCELARIYLSTRQIMSMLDGIRTTLYGTAFASCATLLGFVITTATVTDAVMQNSQWKEFRGSFAYSQVQDIYFDTIRWLSLSALLFLVFLIADADTHPQLVCEVISAWLVCVLISRMWRSISALEMLLRMNSFKSKSKAR